MNIANKTGFYRELARVLKPSGQLAFHDIFAGAKGGLLFPVPWAADASISHLTAVEALKALMTDEGFAQVRWEDKSDASVTFFQAGLERGQTEGLLPVGLHLLMGNDAATKFTNVLRNLEEDRVRVVQAVMKRIL